MDLLGGTTGQRTTIFLLFTLISCVSSAGTAGEWQALFNGKDLTGWDTYLGPKYSAEKGDFAGDPVGLNNDPDKVFTVVNENGERVIRVSGEHFGGISTINEYENYHLQLQFKWGEKKYAPRADAKRDSGLLYSAVGPQGVSWSFWMRSVEFQIQEGDCGDYWGLDQTVIDIPAVENKDGEYVYTKGAKPVTLRQDPERSQHVVKAENKNTEKPHGQWNTLDLYNVNGTSVHVVNGLVKMILTNSRQVVNGEEVPLTKGKIQLQSEGAEVYYRNIRIKNIIKIPDAILNQ